MKKSKFFSEFKEFISKGNVMDLAIGMVVGSTFTKIVNSMVNDILMPIVSIITGKTNFTNMFIALDGNSYMTLEEAQSAGATVIAYGNLIEMIVNFLLTALFLFIIVKATNKLRSFKDKKDENVNEEEAK